VSSVLKFVSNTIHVRPRGNDSEEFVISTNVTATFLDDVLEGLSAEPARLPCKYFYDKRGSELFDAICELEAYYLTRTETAIMEASAEEMALQFPPGCRFIELGSGSSIKTRLLLDHAPRPFLYVPVDISRSHLYESAAKLSESYTNVSVQPLCADFMQALELPEPPFEPAANVVYFPGSTIGNFDRDGASALLGRIQQLCGPDGGLLIGIDLAKEVSVLEAAYNDPQGVTAQFNLNLLRRINREVDGDFDLSAFDHVAEYNPRQERVEMYLLSTKDQQVHIGEQTFSFKTGDRIHTENSHKYTLESFASLASANGFKLVKKWTDPREYFAVLYLETVS